MFKDYGVGFGYRPFYSKEFEKKPPKEVSWIEVITENYLPWGKSKRSPSLKNLLKLRESLPVALHGVSMNLGSTDSLKSDYLSNLKNLIDAVQPMWVSDHLCWTGINNQNLHDLLPLPYTKETVKLVSKKIQKVQDFLGHRILIENLSSYIEFESSEMSEWEFLTEIIKTSDCGLLLDINNVYVSSVNHKFNPLEYLKNIPQNKVAQIHLAGHRKKNGLLIDTHDEPICKNVWQLFQWWNVNYGKRSAMIERDDSFPKWQFIQKELKTLQSMQIIKEDTHATPSLYSKTI